MIRRSSILKLLQSRGKFLDLRIRASRIVALIRDISCHSLVAVNAFNVSSSSAMRHHDEQIAERFVAVEKRLDYRVGKFGAWQVDVKVVHIEAIGR